MRTGNPATPQDEADVRVEVNVTDVRWKSDLSDYTGSLQVRNPIRVTDRNSGAAQDEAGTLLDAQLPIAVPCASTDDPSIGATCSLSTTVDALTPGMVVEGKRSNWQLGQLEVFDGGAGGVAGAADARVFERQGLFVP